MARGKKIVCQGFNGGYSSFRKETKGFSPFLWRKEKK